MRDEPGVDLLAARLRDEDPAARAARRAHERETTYARAWAAARRANLSSEPAIGRFILERLHPDLPAVVLDRFEARLREREEAGLPGIRRPAGEAAPATGTSSAG